MTVKVHVWARPPYWRERVCSTSGDTLRELTFPNLWMGVRATPFSHTLAFSLKERVKKLFLAHKWHKNVSIHRKDGNL